jgi:hypothetical protein
LEAVRSSVDTIKIVEENDKNPKSDVSQLDLEKINFVDFLGVENFLLSFPSQNFNVGSVMLQENWILWRQEIIGTIWKNFKESEVEKINKQRVKI